MGANFASRRPLYESASPRLWNPSAGGGSGGRSIEQLLNTWIRLPLLGENSITLTRNASTDYELVMYPRLHGCQLHFFVQNGGMRSHIGRLGYFEGVPCLSNLAMVCAGGAALASQQASNCGCLLEFRSSSRFVVANRARRRRLAFCSNQRIQMH